MQVGNVSIDPLDLDSQLPEPIDLHQVGTGYDARVKMGDMRLFGLSRIELDRVSVTRGENLTDLVRFCPMSVSMLYIEGGFFLRSNMYIFGVFFGCTQLCEAKVRGHPKWFLCIYDCSPHPPCRPWTSGSPSTPCSSTGPTASR